MTRDQQGTDLSAAARVGSSSLPGGREAFLFLSLCRGMGRRIEKNSELSKYLSKGIKKTLTSEF